MSKLYKNFVCPVCFNQLKQCTCNNCDSLIEIDEPIQKLIRILNTKGYYTRYSCSGHYHPKGKKGCGYVTFDIAPKTAPNGFILRNNRLYFEYVYNNKYDFKIQQDEVIKGLEHWACSLPNTRDR